MTKQTGEGVKTGERRDRRMATVTAIFLWPSVAPSALFPAHVCESGGRVLSEGHPR